MTKFSLPPSFEPTESLKHNHTPKKAAILGAVCYLKKYYMRFRKQDVFQHFDISERTGFRWTTKNEPCKLYNYPDSGPDLRGRKRKLSRNNLRKMEDFLLGGFKYRVLNCR